MDTGVPNSYANAVSADGAVVVGGDRTEGGRWQAFRSTLQGGMESLGMLPGEVHESAALTVSADGSIVLGSIGSPNSPYEPFI